MSDTTKVDHAAAIREILACLVAPSSAVSAADVAWTIRDTQARAIEHHTDALAADLVAERVRTARLEAALSREERAKKTIPVRLSVDVRDRLRALAKAEGKTVGVMILELIDNRELGDREARS